ncbi:MAG TPA: AI-2E family transporter [Motilibacterales bacterium]|nr:AI-2E family transporter [Motilibacterales bacterium]
MTDDPAGPPVPMSEPEASTGSRATRPADHGPDGAPASEATLANLPWVITEPTDDRSLPPWFRRAVILVLVLVAASKIVLWGFGQLTSFWYTLFFSFFIGLAMEPVVNFLQKHGIRRGVGTFLVMGGLILSAVAFFTVFGALLAAQLSELVRSFPTVLATVLEWSNERFGTQLDPNQILDSFGLGAEDIADLAKNLGVGLLSVLGTAVNWVFSLFTIMLFSFYFAADGPHFRRTVASWLPPQRQRTFLTVVDISTQKAGSYVISRGLLALISAVIHGIAFFLLDLPFWLPMALWVGMVSQFIPTIGTYLAGALPVTIALVEGDAVKALIVFLVVVAYQQVENYLVAPRITRTTLEIHPAVAFGSVIAGAALFGITGALLAIPVVATVQSVVTVYGRRYQLVEEFGGAPGESDRERVAAAMRAADPRYSGSRSVRRPPIPPAQD